jgi:predicted MFS family arabinose efflux permease
VTGPLPRGGTVLLACIAATAIANNYAIQPALATVAAGLGVPLSLIGLVPAAALAGSMTGFAFLLPLTDHLAPSRLIPAQLAVLAAALILAASSPGAVVLVAAYLLIGVVGSVTAQASTIAGRYAPPGRRTAAVAAVASGMSAGVLLGRLAGGTLTGLLGWRGMLLVFAVLAVLGAVSAAAILPRQRPRAQRGYRAAIIAVPLLLRRHPQLRRAATIGGLWYFAFNLTWVALALALARPPYSLRPGVIGLYSAAGLLGFLTVPVAGRLADRRGTRAVIIGSMLVSAAGVTLLVTGLHVPAVTGLGLALFDAGVFAAQAANLSRIMALDPRVLGSLASVYLVLYFAVGAIGVSLAGPLLATLGWRGISLTSLAVVLLAAVLGASGTRSAATAQNGDFGVPERVSG